MKSTAGTNLKGHRTFFLLVVLWGLTFLHAQTTAPGRVTLPGSIVAVPQPLITTPVAQSRTGAGPSSVAGVEFTGSMEIEVSLKMRNFAELQQRVANGERVSNQEMLDNYFPLAEDYDAVIAWLTGQGLTVTETYPNHLSVFVRGTVGQISAALQVGFARVTADGSDYISAVTAPSLPASLAPAVLGVGGLQPHLQMHPPRHPQPAGSDGLKNFASPYLPKDIRKAYGIDPVTSVTGANQTIGIVMSAYPSNTDLTSFWTASGIKQTLGNITKIAVAGGPKTHPDFESRVEITLDVEWASAMAPAAKIRIYAMPDLFPSTTDKVFQKIISDANSVPSMRQVSMSFGGGEHSIFSLDELQAEAQLFLAMANEGITVFASTGDGGSRPDDNTGSFNKKADIQVEYPSSDPNVTAVGGTKLTLNANNGSVASETAWSGTGGGESEVFTRPSWQTGAGVPDGLFRFLPDLAGPADPNKGAFVVFQGTNTTIGGTSWSAPMMAGLCAMINQARSDTGQEPLGLLGPQIYPLLGTSAFRDITSGNNGDFSATVGYDECTGVGVPNFSLLFAELTNVPIVAPSTTFTFSGNAGYTFPDFQGTSINLTTNELINGSNTNPTSWFRLQLWATTAPYSGGTLTGQLLGQSIILAPLPAGNEYPSLNLPTPFTPPAAGTYHLTMVVLEYVNGAFRQVAGGYANLPDTVTTAQITAQPADAAVMTGGTANFTVVATGNPVPPNYEWQLSTDGGLSWSIVTESGSYAGVASATLTVSNATLDMFGQEFRCRVSNGFNSPTSSAATLTVYDGPTSVSYSAAPNNQAVTTGQAALFHAGVLGFPLPDYQWQRQAAGSSTWTNLSENATYSGTTSATLLISATAVNMSGDHFRLVATNSINTSTSASALLSVKPVVIAPKITVQPAGVAARKNTTVKFNVKATGTTPFNYAWRKNSVALKNGGTVSGATAATLVLKKVTATNAGTYSVVVSNGAGKATSASAKLTVK